MSLLKKYRNKEISTAAETLNQSDITALTGNIYQSLNVASRRSNQIAAHLKEELNGKLEDFAIVNDTMEEVIENREQIEISKYYERLPHPTLLAMKEFKDGELYHRDQTAEDEPTGEEEA